MTQSTEAASGVIEPEFPAVPGASRSSESVANTSALHNLLPHLLRMLRREPAVALSLGYLFVALAGIFYNERFYAKFGIPVLTLSQISDFLAAGIQQPVALLLLVSTIPLCWFFDFFNTRSRRRHLRELAHLAERPPSSPLQRLRLRFLDWRVTHLWYTQLGYLLVVIAYGWMFVSSYADYRAAAVRRGEAAEVRVWLNGGADALEAKASGWSYLGAVGNYVFLYDRMGARSVVLPVNNIARIEPVQSEANAGRPLWLVPIP